MLRAMDWENVRLVEGIVGRQKADQNSNDDIVQGRSCWDCVTGYERRKNYQNPQNSQGPVEAGLSRSPGYDSRAVKSEGRDQSTESDLYEQDGPYLAETQDERAGNKPHSE